MADTPDESEAALAVYAEQLADAVDEALPRWVERCVRRVADQQRFDLDDAAERRLAAAVDEVRNDGGQRIRTLLATDIDEQAGTPLALLRSLVRYPTEVLRAIGAVPVSRDEFQQRSFPEDVYDLSPASFADVDPALHEPGLAWGAAKAYVHLARRKAEGSR
jgi:hypothetical protein